MFSPTTTRADSIHPDGTLIDRYGRRISYLRLSVIDRCDFRCRYCMPMKMTFLPKKEILSLEELLLVAKAFEALGVNKFRLTGGEPLVRRNLTWLCERIAALPGVRELAITTNGSQLPRLAKDMVAAGVSRINISLDTLDADRFRRLTRTGELESVLHGIDAAMAAGFPGGVKLNTVMLRGFNDDEIVPLARFATDLGADISYIEEMPLGEIGHFRGDTYYSADDALEQLQAHFSLQPSDHDSGGPARYQEIIGTPRRIGFITPHSHNFCHRCNRVRVTATGELYPCLGQNDAVALKPFIRRPEGASVAELRQQIESVMHIKPKGHDFDVRATDAKVVRFMSVTGG